MSAVSQPLMKAGLGNSPQQSAQIEMANQAKSQANLARAVGGRRRKTKRTTRGGSTTGGVPAPQMAIPYSVPGAGDQNPNAIMLNNAKSQNQGAADAIYDSSAKTMKGGCVWGCYSGGSKRRKKRRKNTRRKRRKSIRKNY